MTDALGGGAGPPSYRDLPLADMSFARPHRRRGTSGLIRGGCARLSPAAREYPRPATANIVTARDATVARQVLHVVMRDLDPGR